MHGDSASSAPERGSSVAAPERVPLLEARQLTVRFGGLVAVDRVDARFHAGELVGIIGPNGAGKTTFFNAISGVQTPTSGRLELAGRDLTGRAWRAPSRRRASSPTCRWRPTSSSG